MGLRTQSMVKCPIGVVAVVLGAVRVNYDRSRVTRYRAHAATGYFDGYCRDGRSPFQGH